MLAFEPLPLVSRGVISPDRGGMDGGPPAARGSGVQSDIAVQSIAESVLAIAGAEREARETEARRGDHSECRKHDGRFLSGLLLCGKCNPPEMSAVIARARRKPARRSEI